MLCAVYKSSKKDETFLYLPKRDDFSKVPEDFMAVFGTPIFVLMIDISKRKSLALVDIEKVKKEIVDPGYFIQLPPPKENLHDQHLDRLKKQGKLKTND
ncbi:YcgL domain-containing protein [Catenovulum maritimum]|uniref:YcgL domain-containing protein XM47_02925 n=1 Tax=Catenovulum maritimum TaxID=1513271 RepID=A0A0J8JPE3_9ALTE|nr:YcgL domain-containing protein [Catenovulum maritimum]KMT66506.1 hypothetical protein XM47_02925 [Catenovulum maritimum]